jgi:hypothetical protein
MYIWIVIYRLKRCIPPYGFGCLKENKMDSKKPVLAVRFLRQGRVPVYEVPANFENMSLEEKKVWTQNILRDLSDAQLFEAMADYENPQKNGYFDDTFDVEAIEAYPRLIVLKRKFSLLLHGILSVILNMETIFSMKTKISHFSWKILVCLKIRYILLHMVQSFLPRKNLIF